MPMHFCSVRGCTRPTDLKADGRWVCAEHRATVLEQRRRRMDSGATGRAEFRSKTYGTERWKRAAKAQLREHPTCVACEAEGFVKAAKVADHIRPHRGDLDKFWVAVPDGLQSLCFRCHRAKSARESRR